MSKLDRGNTLSFTLISIDIQSYSNSPTLSKESDYIHKTRNNDDLKINIILVKKINAF